MAEQKQPGPRQDETLPVWARDEADTEIFHIPLFHAAKRGEEDEFHILVGVHPLTQERFYIEANRGVVAKARRQRQQLAQLRQRVNILEKQVQALISS